MVNASERFYDWVRSKGYEPRTPIVPGVIHSMPAIGKRGSNRSARCQLFLDCDAGWLRDHTLGQTFNWFAGEDTACSGYNTDEKQRAAEAQKKRQATRLHGYNITAQKVRSQLLELPGAKRCFPHFIHKQIEDYHFLFRSHTRYGKPVVVIPLEYEGEIVNWQSIDGHGNKRPYTGARYADTYAVIAKPDQYRRILIAEGVATTCTVSMLEPESMAIAAIYADNLLSVAQTFRELYPHNEIVICGDDDRDTEKRTGTNPGRLKANEAAKAVAGKATFPLWPVKAPLSLTDFNDLYIWSQQQ